MRWETINPVEADEELRFNYRGFTEDFDVAEEQAALSGGRRGDKSNEKRKRDDEGAPRKQPRPAGGAPRLIIRICVIALTMALTAASDAPLPQEVIEFSSFVPAWATMRDMPSARPGDDAHASSSFTPVWCDIATANSGARAQPRSIRPLALPGAQRAARRLPGKQTRQLSLDSRSKPPLNGIAKAKHRSEDATDLHLPNRHPYLAPAYGTSSLRRDQVDNAHDLAERLVNDNTPGRIRGSRQQLTEMALAVAEARADGINPRTASKDAFALREWEAYAAEAGFDPNLQSSWATRFPERESLKLASWLLWRAQRAVPRSKKGVAKPMSIYQNYLALRRVFRSRDVTLTAPGTVRETLRGLIRRFIRRFGIDTLRPKRVEPVTPDIIRKCLAQATTGSHVVRGIPWHLGCWTCFIVLAWMVINLSVGSRKGESTMLPGDVDDNDWFNRDAVTCVAKGRTHADPDGDVWASLAEGDHVLLAPRGSKCDQWGTCHGTEPIVLPFHDDDLNAARWIRDIELKRPVRGTKRKATPLFCTEDGSPFKDAAFAALIMATLAAAIGEARAKLLSPHSWRVWLASSLRMCNASDARIQAMGRWLNPDSIKLYH